MTDRSRAFDDITNLFANAAGAVKGIGDEARAMGRAQAEKLIADLDLVTRDEYDVLKARLDKQAAEIADLKAVLDSRLAKPASKPASKPVTKPAAKKTAKPAAKKAAKKAKPTTTRKTTTRAKSSKK